jgi:two-component system sensor histidine kinase GlrK
VAWAGAGAALLLSIVVWFFVVRTISRGLRGLTRATRTVAEGRFDHRLEVEGSDEFAELARDFNSMTERLAELDELKRHFVSRVSHDLKSPLASIQEANNLLLDGLPGELSEDQERLLELSRENGERLGEMISKLLETSRLEAGAETPDLARHDLSQVVREAAERLDPSFRKRGVELELRIPGNDQPAMCDAERVEQLVENLLENARRFAPERSVVRVVLEGVDEGDPDVPAERWRQVQANGTGDGHGGAVLLSVEDAGPGVPEEEKERVFDRFFQSDGRGRPGGGVGLGLALCREVVAVHGGTIWVEDAPRGGARFRVLLPREPGTVAGGEEAAT